LAPEPHSISASQTTLTSFNEGAPSLAPELAASRNAHPIHNAFNEGAPSLAPERAGDGDGIHPAGAFNEGAPSLAPEPGLELVRVGHPDPSMRGRQAWRPNVCRAGR